MKKRICALLLAAVMLLSMGAGALAGDESAVTGETQVTDDAKTTGDAKTTDDAKTADETDVTDDAGADVTDDAKVDAGTDVTDDAKVDAGTDVTDDAGANAGTDVTGGETVTGNEVKVADEPAPADEPTPILAAADGVTVTLKNNIERALTITQADNTPFKSGEKVPKGEGGWYVLKVSPEAGDIGVTVEGDKKEPVYTKVQNGEILFQDRDEDGAVTITLDLLSGFQLYVKNSISDVTCTIMAPLNGGETVADGGWVYVPSAAIHDVPLKAALTEGYTFDAGQDFVKYDTSSGTNNDLNVQDSNGDKKVTLTVVKELRLRMGSAELVYVSSDQTGTKRYTEGTLLKEDQVFYVKVRGELALTATGADVEPADFYYGSYDLDPMTGDITRLYAVTPDGSGDVTLITGPATEEAPAKVTITYAGPDEAFVSGKDKLMKYAFPGEIFNVEIKPGYGLEVNGELTAVFEDEHGRRASVVVSGGTELTLTAVKLHNDAMLAVVAGDKYDLVSTFGGDSYLMDGLTIPNGNGYILVNNGTAIDEEATEGGICSFQDIVTVPGWAFYRRYYVQATDDTVKIKLKAVQPIRWVETWLINNFEDKVTVESYLIEEDAYGGDNYWIAVDPGDETNADISIRTADGAAKGTANGFDIILEGGTKEQAEVGPDRKDYNIKVNDGADELIIRVMPAVELEAKAPDTPTEDHPGVSDKAGTEKKLLDKTMDVVEDAVKGGTPTGVTKADAQAIAAAAAAGKKMTTELVVAEAGSAPADKDAIEAAAGGAEVALYVNAEIVVKADGTTIGHITQTDEPIQLAVVLSQDVLDKGHIFFVVRSHGDKTDILPATLNGNTLTFSTDKFSTFGIAVTDDISYATVDGIADQTWTGKAITPKPVVKVNGKTLTEGTDYTLSYKDNVEAGTATVVITGKTPYTGTKEVTFKIVKPAASGSGGGSGEKLAPQTGDETPVALYAGVLALSAGALALTVARRKKTSR